MARAHLQDTYPEQARGMGLQGSAAGLSASWAYSYRARAMGTGGVLRVGVCMARPGPLRDQRPPVSRDSSGRPRQSQEINNMKTHNAGKSPATTQPPVWQPGAAPRLPSASTLDPSPPLTLVHQTLYRLADNLLASNLNQSSKGLPQDHGTPSPSLLDSASSSANVTQRPQARQRSMAGHWDEADPTAGTQTWRFQQDLARSEARPHTCVSAAIH